MTENEDSSHDLSAPLIVSPSIFDNDNVTGNPSINEVVDINGLYVQPCAKMFVEDVESALQPFKPQNLPEGLECVDKETGCKSSEDEACHEKIMNGVAGAVPNLTERRKVQWVDNYGKDIAQVKEFEPRSLEQSWLDQCYLDVREKFSDLCCPAWHQTVIQVSLMTRRMVNRQNPAIAPFSKFSTRTWTICCAI